MNSYRAANARHPLFRSLLPLGLILLFIAFAAIGWLGYSATHPPTQAYLVTPARYAQLSEQGSRATDETWRNRDGSQSRGWLLRGAEGAPAVLMLHAYGSNRSALLNLGVKLNETTNYTVLWTDARAHGDEPLPGASTFGGREAVDALDAIDFLRELKTPAGAPLIAGDVGICGVEMGAYSALLAATKQPAVRALVLDSPVVEPSDVLRREITARAGFAFAPLDALVSLVTRAALLGNFTNESLCAKTNDLDEGVRVLLVSSKDAGAARDATRQVADCFNRKVTFESNTDLPVTSLRGLSVNSQAAEAYDRRVIDFLDTALTRQR